MRLHSFFWLLFSCSSLWLSGCVTSSQVTIAEYETNPEQRFPLTTVYYQRPSEAFLESCQRFEGESMLHSCEMNSIPLEVLQQEMLATELFDGVLYANDKVDYQVLITAATFKRDGGGNIGDSVQSANSSGANSFRANAVINASVTISWNGALIKNYNYQLPFSANAALFNANPDLITDLARSVVSHMVRDFQQDSVFTYSTLQAAIDSSNYATDLNAPNQAASFIRDDILQLPDPFQGVQIRYSHEQFMFDYVDVFVYPIPDWQWDNEIQTLQREATQARREIQYFAEQNQFGNFKLNLDNTKTIELDGKEKALLMFDGGFSVGNENYITRTYLAIVEDKFVKARASFVVTGSPMANTDEFFNALISTIKVPKESTFMNQIRRRWQDQ